LRTSLVKTILAVVALKGDTSVEAGGTVVFYAQSEEEQEKMATTLSRITEGVVHELENGLKILVKH
jgi:hypothetical protein